MAKVLDKEKSVMEARQAGPGGSAGKELALLKRDVVDVVVGKVREFLDRGELNLPANYSPHNAMKSAWLILQSTVDKSGAPVLRSCTRDSIANSLLDMVIQGLNPAKKQCYFIAYGNKLICQRSYFGAMAVAKNIAGADDVWAEVIYKDDEFEYEIVGRRKAIKRHVQKLENVKAGNIVGAYCVIDFADGRSSYTEIMTIEQLKRAWLQGPNFKDGANGVHQKFDDQMAKKTVINRACKGFINSSNDSAVLQKVYNRAEEAMVEEEVRVEIEENANVELLDVGYAVVDDDEPYEETDGAEALDVEAEPVVAEAPAPRGKASQKTQQTLDGPGF